MTPEIRRLAGSTFGAALFVACLWLLSLFSRWIGGPKDLLATCYYWMAVSFGAILGFLYGVTWCIVGFLSLRIWLTERRLRP
jgi:hypothetical protein